jgi:hypothetical protein
VGVSWFLQRDVVFIVTDCRYPRQKICGVWFLVVGVAMLFFMFILVHGKMMAILGVVLLCQCLCWGAAPHNAAGRRFRSGWDLQNGRGSDHDRNQSHRILISSCLGEPRHGVVWHGSVYFAKYTPKFSRNVTIPHSAFKFLALGEVYKGQIVEMAVGIMPFSRLYTSPSAKNLKP